VNMVHPSRVQLPPGCDVVTDEDGLSRGGSAAPPYPTCELMGFERGVTPSREEALR
jgi:hypothetical protein